MLSPLDTYVLRLVLDAVRNDEAHGHAEKQANRDEEPQQIRVLVWRREYAAAHAWVPIWSRHVVVAEEALGSSHQACAERHSGRCERRAQRSCWRSSAARAA